MRQVTREQGRPHATRRGVDRGVTGWGRDLVTAGSMERLADGIHTSWCQKGPCD